MSDLKPCPFCGLSDLVYNSATGRTNGRFVRCTDCNTCGPLAEDDARAKAAWNEAPRRNEVMELPEDADGEPIRLGEELHLTAHKGRVEVVAMELSRDGSWIVEGKCGGALTYWRPDSLTHVAPDSLESIEKGIYHLVMSEYLDDPEADVKAIMERIGKLTKEEE